ncbi:hypothetical protein BDV41DRAFT_532597 [Aspergillus transmontanensis]|uniref:Uncharacterized protein n=1 Tax=Aspergillus transmontanensis TaxID=1034304 RepID=A0A5N6W2I0_9EURO|nr:hypothetical protein BDV41DRAFT_532597 [Aspergillus transmontanensis]
MRKSGNLDNCLFWYTKNYGSKLGTRSKGGAEMPEGKKKNTRKSNIQSRTCKKKEKIKLKKNKIQSCKKRGERVHTAHLVLLPFSVLFYSILCLFSNFFVNSLCFFSRPFGVPVNDSLRSVRQNTSSRTIL